MRTLGDPTHAAQRARRELTIGASLVATGCAVLVTSGWVLAIVPDGFHALLPLAGLLSIAAGARLVAGWWRWRQRRPAEAGVLRMLGEQFNAAYTLLCDVRVPELHGAMHTLPPLLVGPHGVLVLHVQHLPGSYRVDGDRWWVLTASGARQWEWSPTWDASRSVRPLRRFFQGEGLGGIPVLAAVVLTSGAVEVRTPAPGAAPASAAVLAADDIATYVRSIDGSAELGTERVDAVVKALAVHARTAGD